MRKPFPTKEMPTPTEGKKGLSGDLEGIYKNHLDQPAIGPNSHQFGPFFARQLVGSGNFMAPFIYSGMSGGGGRYFVKQDLFLPGGGGGQKSTKVRGNCMFKQKIRSNDNYTVATLLLWEFLVPFQNHWQMPYFTAHCNFPIQKIHWRLFGRERE